MAKKTSKSVWTFYIALWKDNKIKIILIFLLSSIKVGVSLLLPIISMKILDVSIPQEKFSEIVYLSMIVLLLSILQSMINYVLEKCYALLGKSIYLKYQLSVLEHFTCLSGDYYCNMNFGEVYNTIYEDVERIQGLVSGNVFQFIVDVISAIGMMIIIINMQWDLAFFLIMLLPIIYLCQRYFQKRGKKLSVLLRKKDGKLIGILEDVISNIVPFQYSQCGDFFIGKYNAIVRESKKSEIKLQLLNVKNGGILNFLAQLFSIIVIGYGGVKVIFGSLTIGGLIAFNMYGNQMVSPVLSASSVLMYLQTNLVSLERIQSFLEISGVDFNDTGIQLKNIQDVKFENVDFSYMQNSVLKKFSAKFDLNKITMVVGESGSGKSTILSLLYRFWNCADGQISINGINIEEYNVKTLRKQVTVVSQEMYLFNDTILNNLIMDQKKSDLRIAEALRIVCLDSIVQQLPNGLNTMIGENGIRFSGGECQRICLARAILRNTPILVLDEATSALDQITEQKILKNIREMVKGKIIIIITHRMENCKFADNIVVIKDGKNIGGGTHEKLISTNEYYKKLCKRNFVA